MKKIIDDRGRLFGIINVIDVIVIVVVALLSTAVLLRTGRASGSLSTVNTVPVKYVATVTNIRDTSAKHLRPGDKVYTSNGIYIGTISEAVTSDSYVTSRLLDGTYVKARSYDRYIVTMTIETECSVADGIYYAERTFELCVNTEQRIHTKYINSTMVITEVIID